MKYYKEKSKLYLLVFLLPLVYSYFYLNERGLSIYYWFIVVPLFSFSSKTYLIRDETLKVPSKYIDINSILKIERRKWNIKSKYFSFDKLIITFDEDQTDRISPKDEIEFVNHLLSINPNIEIKI